MLPSSQSLRVSLTTRPWVLQSRAVLVVAMLMFGVSGCVETALREGREPLDYAPVAPPLPEPRNEGGIWQGKTGGGSFLF